jgi:hypothetical protein
VATAFSEGLQNIILREIEGNDDRRL